MKLEDALTLFKLPNTPTASQLASAYRRLVKHYHPDFNPTRPDWAHKRMTQINEAYSLISDVLAQAGTESGARVRSTRSASRDRQKAQRSRSARDGRAQTGPALAPESGREYRKAAQRLLDGIYIYYQYGLQNVHQRQEGTPRLRYRQAVRYSKDSLFRTTGLLESVGPTVRRDGDLKALHSFARSFLQNMLIEKYYIPSPDSFEHKAYRHYQSGSEHLDRAIQHTLFGEQLQAPGRAHEGSLYVSHQEFLYLLVNYTNSTWVPEATIKLHLLDTLSSSTQARCFMPA